MASTADPSLESEIPIAFSGEVQLQSWGDSSRIGRTVTLRLPEDEPEHPFRRLATPNGKTPGQRFMAVFVLINDDETPVKEAEAKPYGKNARELHRTGWFFDRRVLAAFGSPEELREWASRQPCLLCKNPPVSQVLRGPSYTALPVCNTHRHAEPTALASHQPKLLKAWISDQITALIGVDSLGYVKPEYLLEICRKRGIEDTLPKSYLSPEQV